MINIIAAVALLFSVSVVNASTILMPTDGDVNFFVDPSFDDNPDILRIAIFNDSEAVAPGGMIVTSTGLLEVVLSSIPAPPIAGGVIDFLGPNPNTPFNYQASNGLTVFNLDAINDNFIVGVSLDGGATWMADNGNAVLPANSATLSFGNIQDPLLVDVRVVPVPAAVWLFGSGLLGLVAVARRRA